jgi:hypothetical protein
LNLVASSCSQRRSRSCFTEVKSVNAQQISPAPRHPAPGQRKLKTAMYLLSSFSLSHQYKICKDHLLHLQKEIHTWLILSSVRW